MALAPRALALAVVTTLLVSACSPDSSDETPRSQEDRDIALATRVAREAIEAEDATVRNASFTIATGKVAKSNTGEQCLSGKLLRIRLIGTFPHIVTTGLPIERDKPALDFAVTALNLTADASTGLVCSKSVQTGDAAPEAGAVLLALSSLKPESDSTAEPSETAELGPTPGRPPERSELIGTWRPAILFGVDVRQIRRIHGDRVTLMFSEGQAGLQVSAYDGCNWLGARVRLEPSGRFSTSEQASTQRGCLPGPNDRETRNAEVVTKGSRMLLRGAQLVFLDSQGQLIAEYMRTRPGP